MACMRSVIIQTHVPLSPPPLCSSSKDEASRMQKAEACGGKLLMSGACHQCGAETAEFACSRCKSVRFCSQECAKAAWAKHKAWMEASALELNKTCILVTPQLVCVWVFTRKEWR
eukprot:2082326-Amphidinium_carterae.3